MFIAGILLVVLFFLGQNVSIVSNQLIDDFDSPLEVTTLATTRLPGPVQVRTAGRTRQSIYTKEAANLRMANISSHGQMLDNYCCFWIYQQHPALPPIWEHRKEYDFDFLFNGKFIKNQRNYEGP